MKSSWIRLLARFSFVAACMLQLSACIAVANLRDHTTDPTVVIHGATGDELGVSTSYGIVFLGRHSNRGRVEFTSWFGDGPSLEEGVIEPVGDELYTTSAEILLSNVPLLFQAPDPGETVVVRGRRGSGIWEFEAELTSDPRVEGLLLKPSPELEALANDQLGAGVFFLDATGRKQLIGLVTGRMQIQGPDGARHGYVTVSGPDQLWRLVLHRRNSERPRRRVYRDDIL